MKRSEVEAIVREALSEELGHGPRQAMRVYGNCSKKMLGDIVGDALLHSPIVVIDGTGIRRVASRKVMWRLDETGPGA